MKRPFIINITIAAIVSGCGGTLTTDQPYVIEVESPTPENNSVPLLATWWSPSYDTATGLFRRNGRLDVSGLTGSLGGDDVFSLSLNRPLLNGFPPTIQFDVGPLGGVYNDDIAVVAPIGNSSPDGILIDPPTVTVGQFIVGGSRVSDNEFRVIIEYRYDCGENDVARFSGTVTADTPTTVDCVSERITLHGTAGAASF